MIFTVRRYGQMRHKKPRPLVNGAGLLCLIAWQCPTFTWGGPILSSAQSVFTSEFEMGSGGSRSLLPPDKAVAKSSAFCCPSRADRRTSYGVLRYQSVLTDNSFVIRKGLHQGSQWRLLSRLQVAYNLQGQAFWVLYDQA